MLESNYTKWLKNEVYAIQRALIVALEKRDNLLYIEEPALKEEYMQKIGGFEEQVLKAELDVALAEKKKQLIQTAINRREPIDIEAIEAQIEEERKEKLEELNKSYNKESLHSTMSDEDKEELQKLYKEIVRDFHPEVHKDLTDFQKQLYERALAAYQRQQLRELRLVYEMLYARDIEDVGLEVSDSDTDEDDNQDEYIDKLQEDYALASELFECFEPLEKDGILLSSKKQYEGIEKGIWEEIERIQMRFPFTAKETMEDEEKTKEYLKSLETRMRMCDNELTKLNAQISKLLEV